MGCSVFVNIAVLAFECTLMYWVSAVWPHSHDDQKLMISWAFYSLCVGITFRSLNFISHLLLMNAGLDLQKILDLSCLTCCAKLLAIGVSIFQAGWCIIGIMRFMKMDGTSDAWFTYGILTEVIVASLMGISIYAVILIMLMLCSCCCCIGCELESIINKLPESLKSQITNPEGKTDTAALMKMLTGQIALTGQKKGTDEVSGQKGTEAPQGTNFVGAGVKTGTGAPVVAKDEENMPLKDVEEGQAPVDRNK
jgi:hypothetical protein